MVRSSWYKRWDDIEQFNQATFPGVGLDALKFLHLERKILFHGHEPLDAGRLNASRALPRGLLFSLFCFCPRPALGAAASLLR